MVSADNEVLEKIVIESISKALNAAKNAEVNNISSGNA